MSKDNKEEVATFGRSSFEILQKSGIKTETLVDGYEAKQAVVEAGKEIRAMRESVGLSQTELAKAAGMQQAEISRLENGSGKQGPSVATLNRLAKACQQKFYCGFIPTGKDDTDLEMLHKFIDIIADEERGGSAFIDADELNGLILDALRARALKETRNEKKPLEASADVSALPQEFTKAD